MQLRDKFIVYITGFWAGIVMGKQYDVMDAVLSQGNRVWGSNWLKKMAERL